MNVGARTESLAPAFIPNGTIRDECKRNWCLIVSFLGHRGVLKNVASSTEPQGNVPEDL